MSLAKELIAKYQLDFPHPSHTEHTIAAINEALERAAQECDKADDWSEHGHDCVSDAVSRIRALKEEL